MSDEEALKLKAELLESGMPKDGPKPCDNFPEYAAGQLYKDALRGRKARVMEEVMKGSKEAFLPLQRVRGFYDLCVKHQRLFDRKFQPGVSAADAEQNRARLRDFIGNNEFVNNDLFASEYKYTLKILFTYGSTFFDENTMGKNILIVRPEKVPFKPEDECQAVIGKEKCKDIANTVFDVSFKDDLPVTIYFPRAPEDRKALFQEFWTIYNSPEPGWYPGCYEFLSDVFPIFYKKMLFNYLDANEQPISDLNTDLKVIWTDILEQIDDTIRTLNVTMDRKQDYLKEFHENLEFMDIQHPIFEQATFEKYFDFVDFSPVPELYQNRHLWSIRPMIEYYIRGGSSNFYTASLTQPASISRVGDKVYIGRGFEAFTYPLHHKSFPPSITYSNFIFALGEEQLSGMIFNAYSKRNELHLRKNRIQGAENAKINSLSEDQLYFINLAQTIVLEQAQNRIDPFADPDAKIWRLFKCLRGFSNSFRCKPGDNFFSEEDYREENYLAKKYDMIEKMMNTSVDPCDDFVKYAAGNFDPQTRFDVLKETLRNILMFTAIADHIDSIRKVRHLYFQCQQGFLPAEPTIDELVDSAIKEYPEVLFPLKEDSPIAKDDVKFWELIKKLYKSLFDKGSRLWDLGLASVASLTITLPNPHKILPDNETTAAWGVYKTKTKQTGEWPPPEYPDLLPRSIEEAKERSELISFVFGIPGFDASNYTVIVPDFTVDEEEEEPISRHDFANALFENVISRNGRSFKKCEVDILRMFPLQVYKLFYEANKRDTAKYKKLKEVYFEYSTNLLQEAENMLVNSEILTNESKDLLLNEQKQNTFAFFEHPFFENRNFPHATADTDITRPGASFYKNNIRQILRYDNEYHENLLKVREFSIDAQHSTKFKYNVVDWGYFLKPLFEQSFPPVLMFSTFGYVMGHEIGHSLILPLFGAPKEIMNIYLCLLKLHHNRCDPERPQLCTNAVRVMNEALADHFGLRFAYSAYRKYYLSRAADLHRTRELNFLTDDQLFFVSWAQLVIQFPNWRKYDGTDPHPPAELRIEQTAANFPAFANAFNCKANTTMNPDKKCALFRNEN
ncbi:unnamed protein product [Bursaphelenchus xylophilus]|uniref:(pine wood nematode) hypothetical protein n=1 Tax=Bursaphelenchus xylophilus TaxID=6326 RepID=A0A1I7RX92_BURXY|nr:unnamed protein product [Bursaphelenchus xylophilus]CAG9121444.1 unnamed protein product [Bursaphelenchus xylophilus]